jgi:hypothetical protein
VVLLSLSVYLAVNPVYSETAFEVMGPVIYASLNH